MTDMIKLANGSEVPVDVFYTWSHQKQRMNLCHPFKGKSLPAMSEEQKLKRSIAQKGRVISEEHRAKIGAANKGNHNIGGRNKGKKMNTGAKISAVLSKPVMTPLGEFPSSKLAAEAYGLKSKEAILYRIKTKPTEYYYINKDAK
jgi:hypothetical protein